MPNLDFCHTICNIATCVYGKIKELVDINTASEIAALYCKNQCTVYDYGEKNVRLVLKNLMLIYNEVDSIPT